jgi:G3E family GTPase
MHLVLVSGFLGSGKTTLVIRLAQAAANIQRKVAILVNEIGEIGIDNQLMRQLDLNVWELLNGCICCTLSGDLVSTLHMLAEKYSPELVLVEPSGAADPRSILNALPYYRGAPLASVQTLTVLDPQRLPVLVEVLTPLVTSQIQHAGLIIISKCDLATDDEITFARQIAGEINPLAKVYTSTRLEAQPVWLAELAPWMS